MGYVGAYFVYYRIVILRMRRTRCDTHYLDFTFPNVTPVLNRAVGIMLFVKIS